MKLGKSRHLKTRPRCLNCDKLLDGVSGVRDGKGDPLPKPGDFTICAYCRTILIFDDKLHFRYPTFVEMGELAHDPRIVAVKPLLKKAFE
jgi:hypothetical protein